MASMTFLINDSTASTGTQPLVQITITTNADGTVTFNITQIDTAGAALGDLRGLFFDLADESLIGSLTTTATPGLTELQQGNDSVVNLGDGATMAGLVGDNGGYDVGIEIGTSGLGKDDIRSFSFTLDSSLRDLTLADFSGVSFGARLTSVGIDLDGNGTIDTARTGSTKVGEVTFQTITPVNDSASVQEDAVANGNVLSNDGAGVGDTLSVTGWTGGALGTAIAPAALSGATVTLNANGSYVVDASGADALAAGQTVTQTFTYTVLQTNVDGTSSHTASFTVTVTGTNDVPVAQASTAAVSEDASISGSVSATDADAGETASLTYALTGAAPTGLSFNPDGSYSFDASSYDSLKAGEQLVLTVPFTASDATSTSTAADLVITVTGTNDVPVAQASTAAVSEDASISGSVSATDADAGETASLTYALTGAAPTGLSFNPDGSYSFDASSYDSLKAGEQLVLTVPFTASDATSTSTAANLVITITGTNDAPVAVADTKAATEDTTVTGSVATNDSDIDHDAVLSYALNAPVAGLTINSNGTYSFDAGNAAYQSLAAGQTTDVVANYTVTDEHGASSASTLTITVTGTADGPAPAPAIYTGPDADPNDKDSVSGGAGADSLTGTVGKDTLSGGAANDTIFGGNGDDVLYGGTGSDSIDGQNNDDLIYGGSGNDRLFGGNNNDTLYGGSGNDTIQGNNNSDAIYGGYGADELTGQDGSDTFYFLSTRDTGDTITDFTVGVDKLNFSAIDTDPLTAGDQAFTYGGQTTTLAADSVIWFQQGGNTFVQVDTDGNVNTAEMQIQLNGLLTLTASDFIL